MILRESEEEIEEENDEEKSLGGLSKKPVFLIYSPSP